VSATAPTDAELTHLSATDLARLIASRSVSATDVVEAHIRHIERVNPTLNAVVVKRFDQARQEAAEADAALARGEAAGPLHGVPVTIKECLDVAGTPTTWGLTDRAGDRAGQDDPVVARLRRAGAIILGKTNVAQLLTGCESHNPLYGRTVNPWNSERSPGGSSGGEGAIIAAGGSPLGIGTDIGGSIRTPAHFCGIHGLKPTSGRVRTAPPRAIYHVRPEAAGMSQAGPLARSVSDLTLALQVLSEGDGQRPVEPGSVCLKGLRIGLYTDDGVLGAAPSVRRAVEEAAEALRQRGAEVVPFTPPSLEAHKLYMSLICADGGAGLLKTLGASQVSPTIRKTLTAQIMSDTARPLIAGLLRLMGQAFAGGVTLPSIRRRTPAQMQELVRQQEAFRERFLGLLDAARLDALLCPPMAFPAVSHGGFDRLGGLEASYDTLFNVTGLPAGVVSTSRVRPGEESDRPASRDQAVTAAAQMELGTAGLPVGVQVAARPWREDVVLALMGAIEEAFQGRPDYPAKPEH
jgi:fatty acid amide hydrolase